MCIQNFVRFCQFILKILSGNEILTSIKGHNSVKINIDLVNVDVHTICQFVLKILSGNKILMSIKGRNPVKISRKMTGFNPKLDLVNVDVHTNTC